MAEGNVPQTWNNSGINYIKTPDGILIQWTSKVANIGSGLEYADITIDLPIAFIDQNYSISASCFTATDHKNNVGVPAVKSVTTNSVTLRVWRNDFSSKPDGSPYILLLTIGRWK